MINTSHTAPMGVIQRIHFDESDSAVYGETGSGYIDFSPDRIMIDYQADFVITDNSPIYETAFNMAFDF